MPQVLLATRSNLSCFATGNYLVWCSNAIQRKAHGAAQILQLCKPETHEHSFEPDTINTKKPTP